MPDSTNIPTHNDKIMDQITGNEQLHLASRQAQKDLCIKLLESGTDPRLRDNHENTAEVLWSGDDNNNPFKHLKQNFYDCTMLDPRINPNKLRYLKILIYKNKYILAWLLDDIFTFYNLVDLLVALNAMDKLNDAYKLTSSSAELSYALQISAAYGGKSFYKGKIASDESFDADLPLSTYNSMYVDYARVELYKLCTLLILAGADPNALNTNGENPEDIWKKYQGPTCNNPFTDLRQELFNLATNSQSLSLTRKQKLLQLISHNHQLLTGDFDGETFLHLIFRLNNSELIKQVMQLEEWPNLSKTISVSGNTLFDIIATTGNTEHYAALKHLATNKHERALALHLATDGKHMEFCEHLVNDEEPIDLNFVLEEQTVLMLAARQGSSKLCVLFLIAGVNPHIQNSEGLTAQEIWITANPKKTNIFKLYFRNIELDATKRTILYRTRIPSANNNSKLYYLSTFSNNIGTGLLKSLRAAVKHAQFRESHSINMTVSELLLEVFIIWKNKQLKNLTGTCVRSAIIVRQMNDLEKYILEALPNYREIRNYSDQVNSATTLGAFK